MVLWFVDHVAIGPVDHAVADHWWQLLIASVPGDHQPPRWIELACQNTQYCITSLCNMEMIIVLLGHHKHLCRQPCPV